MESASRARRPAGSVRENAGTIHNRRFERWFWFAVVIVQFIPHQPGLQLRRIAGAQPFVRSLGAKLPILRGHAGHAIRESVVIVFVGKKSPVNTAAGIGHRRINPRACVGAEPAGIAGEQPGEIDGDEVILVIRVEEGEPFAGEICGDFDAGADGTVREGALGVAGTHGMGARCGMGGFRSGHCALSIDADGAIT